MFSQYVNFFCWVIFTPVNAIFGIISNFVIMIMMLRPSFRHTSHGVALFVLSITDNVTLLYSIDYFIKIVFNIHLDTISSVSCKLLLYFRVLVVLYEPLVLMTITSERLIAVYLPLKLKSLITPFRMALILLVELIICMLSRVYILTNYDLVSFDNSTNAKPVCIEDPRLENLHDSFSQGMAISALGFTFVAFLYLLCGNIAVGIKASGPISIGSASQSLRRIQEARALTASLMAVAIAFVVLRLPSSILLSYVFSTNQYKFISTPNDSYIWLCYSLAQLLLHLNSSLNILLYALKGGKFKNELRLLLCCTRDEPAHSAKPISIQTISSNSTNNFMNVSRMSEEEFDGVSFSPGS